MNERFFSLSAEKQQAIINAGYRVFSQNSYKTSPMSEISDAAGISKSLLFHYFHNKKELYMFLWDKCAEISAAVQESYHKHFNLKADKTLLNMNPEQFIPGLDIPMMYRDMYLASEGFLWEMVQRGNVDMDEMEKGFSKLMNFWKSVYLRNN